MIYEDLIRPRSKKQLDFCNKNDTELLSIADEIAKIVSKDDPLKINELLASELNCIFNTILEDEVNKRIQEKEAKGVNIN